MQDENEMDEVISKPTNQKKTKKKKRKNKPKVTLQCNLQPKVSIILFYFYCIYIKIIASISLLQCIM